MHDLLLQNIHWGLGRDTWVLEAPDTVRQCIIMGV